MIDRFAITRAAMCLGPAQQNALLALLKGPLVRAGRSHHFTAETTRRVGLNTARALAHNGLARFYMVGEPGFDTAGLAMCLTPRGEQFAESLKRVARKILPLASRA